MIAIAGKGKIAVNALYTLIGMRAAGSIHPDLVAIPNSNDLGRDIWYPSLKLHALSNGIRVCSMEEVQSNDDLLLLSLEYDRIIRTDRFRSGNLFNMHFSLLPKYRGVYTSLWPILNGEDHSGVTLHRITPGIDDGPIIAQRRFGIPSYLTCRELYEYYMREAFDLFKDTVSDLLAGTFTESAQNHAEASYYDRKSIDLSRNSIDLSWPADRIQRFVRAFYFPEYQTACFRGTSIRDCIILPESENRNAPLDSETEGCFICRTGDYKNILLIKEV